MRSTKRPETGPHAHWPPPKPVHPDATLMAEVGTGATRRYTVRVSNHLDRPVLYDGPDLAEAVAAMVDIADNMPCGGTMTETITYQSFTSPKHWIGKRHDCGCIEFPEMDLQEGIGITLGMGDLPDQARSCATARGLHAEIGKCEYRTPEWDAAITASVAHLHPEVA